MSKTTHTNPITGRTLKAENIDALDLAMRSRRFAEPKWATFQQWKGTGRTVKPGETGVTLEGASGFQWRVFNVSQTVEGEAEAARPPAVIAPQPAAPAARKAKSAPRAGLKKVIPKGARGAPAVTKETGLPAGWQRHPVTGHPMRPPAGVKVADAIPFGHDPKALAMVRREHAKHGRIGAANTLVMLELAGLKSDAANYRKGMNERRRGEGRVGYNRHMVLTDSAALAKEIAAEFAAAAEPAPEAIEEPTPAAAAEPAPAPAPQPEAKPLSFRERWLAKVGQLAR
jgi:hypothetical protein